MVVCAAALTTFFVSPAGAEVSQVSGGAFGFKINVSLFGGPVNNAGPLPSVTLPSTGATPAVTASELQTEGKFGPAIIFSSGGITVSTEGKLGADGFATSSADIRNANRSQQEVFTAQRVQSNCRATESGASGSTTLSGGVLRTSEGDPDVDDDDKNVNLPNNPPPNTEHRGTIESVGDAYRIIFNEQIPQAGGITINAAHMFLLGPSAVGELIIGQTVCSTAAGAGSGGAGAGGASPTSTTVAGGARGGSGSSGSTSGTGGDSNMPKTGLDVLPLTVLGSEMVAGGVAAVIWAGRRRRWPRR